MPIARKTAELTSAAVTTLLAAFRDYVHTITYDNGREFSAHNIIAEKLDCKGYFTSLIIVGRGLKRTKQ